MARSPEQISHELRRDCLPSNGRLNNESCIQIRTLDINHPYGVRGVGETSIVPPLAAVANAVSNAVGVRMTHIPMSPPRILAALEAERAG